MTIRAGLRRTGWAAALLLAGCGGGAEPGAAGAPGADPATPDGPAAEIAVVDDAGRAVRLARPARRVVSLVPSVTETVVALGGAERLVARTRYDLDPRLASLPSLGGGLDPSVEAIVALAPDLVVAWNARDDRALVPRLGDAGIPVYAAEIQDTTGIFETIERIGTLLAARVAADSLAGALRDSLGAVAADVPPGPRPTALYLIAGDPPRTAGAATFIGQALSIAGTDPALPDVPGDWPTVSLEAVVARDPDVVVLPVGAGLPDRASIAAERGWRDLPAIREGRVIEIEADLLARPGPGLGRAARALRDALSRLPASTGGGEER